MTTFFIFVLGVFIGGILFPKLDTLFALTYRSQVQAICQKFNCQKNEFSYFLEDNDGYYIVSLKDREYRIKFSESRPLCVVYCTEVERVTLDY